MFCKGKARIWPTTSFNRKPLHFLATKTYPVHCALVCSTVNDLTAIGEGRGTVLGLKLDRMADSVTGQTVVDPKVRPQLVSVSASVLVAVAVSVLRPYPDKRARVGCMRGG